MSDVVERLRAVLAGDYDTHGTLSVGGRTICDVPLIRDASDMAEMCHDTAAEIERLREQNCKFLWQVRDTCARAEKAEAERDTLRAEVERLKAERLTIEVRQQDWMPGFAAYLDDGRQINGSAHVLLNIGASMLAVAEGDIPAADVPYHIAEDLMHEIMHALEAWAGVEFDEERIEALIAKYRAAAPEQPR